MDKQTYSLLMYEMIPDETFVYLIPNQVADGFRFLLIEAQNKFVNSDDENDGMRFLTAATSPELEYCADDEFKKHGCLFKQYLQDTAKPIENVIITAFYLSGFVL